MQIIKQGDPKDKVPGQVTCGGCTTVFSFDFQDMHRISNGKWVFNWDAGEDEWHSSGGYYYVRCPVCGAKIRVTKGWPEEPKYYQA